MNEILTDKIKKSLNIAISTYLKISTYLPTFIIILLLTSCDFVQNKKYDTVQATIINLKKERLGKGYYRATYIYSYNFSGVDYLDSTIFWKGNSTLRNVYPGMNISLKVTYNKNKIFETEMLESNFNQTMTVNDCFRVNQINGSKLFYTIRIYQKDKNKDEGYTFKELIKEKGPIFFSSDNILIKRENNKRADLFPILNCVKKENLIHINSFKNGTDYSFVIKPNEYIIQEYGDMKYVYYH